MNMKTFFRLNQSKNLKNDIVKGWVSHRLTDVSKLLLMRMAVFVLIFEECDGIFVLGWFFLQTGIFMSAERNFDRNSYISRKVLLF